MLFWLQLFGSRPLRPAAPVLRRVDLVSGTVVATTLLGMVLVFWPRVPFTRSTRVRPIAS